MKRGVIYALRGKFKEGKRKRHSLEKRNVDTFTQVDLNNNDLIYLDVWSTKQTFVLDDRPYAVKSSTWQLYAEDLTRPLSSLECISQNGDGVEMAVGIEIGVGVEMEMGMGMMGMGMEMRMEMGMEMGMEMRMEMEREMAMEMGMEMRVEMAMEMGWGGDDNVGWC